MTMHLLKGLVDKKTLAILDVLCSSPSKLYHLNSLSNASKVPLTTTMRLVQKLSEFEFIDKVKVGKMHLYKLKDNDKSKFLRGINTKNA